MDAQALWAGVCTAVVTAGLVLLWWGWRGTEGERPPRPGRARRVRAPLSPAAVRARNVRRVAAGVAGIAAWLLTGWLVAVALVPVAVLGRPWLMAPTRADYTGIDRLDALAEWTRRLADLVELGAGLENAILTSRGTCPAPIESEVGDLVSRLQAQWRPADALYRFADAFQDATADKIAAALILRADDRGPGLALALRDFATTVREEVRQRRSIEADRASARATVRWITYLTVAMGGLMAFNRDYAEPYASAVGQTSLVVLMACFTGVLLWMRSVTAYKPAPRILVHDDRSVVTVVPPADTVAVPEVVR
ncbi:type II secretion system F family protein [Embleya sp. NPDC008237]|uniref:type II secretion system F family protein n=1 Tax=Embleya sp. NPDC008237 TaxID=3363978 RepID=UPI0036ED84C9